ncbi:MAG: hypothetical protein GX660_07710 [Clostridiaceae bacterium]|nr:hypothetical protein [Clostridiaceae bacterium]
MRKSIVIILTLLILTATTNAAEELSREKIVKLANREIIELGLLKYDYFKETNVCEKSLSTKAYSSGPRDFIVYGDPHGDFKENKYRYLGYTMSDANFTNYDFPNDVTSTIGLWDRNWVLDPANNSLTIDRAEVKGGDKFNNKPIFEESIRLGLKQISRTNQDGSLLDFPEDKLNTREWHKYVHVYQPPTSVSWGCGIMFHNSSGKQINYLTVPMSPVGLRGDIDAQFEDLPSSVTSGDKVQVGIVVNSTFNRDLTKTLGNAPLFAWKITNKATNTPITTVTYKGHSDKPSENLDIPANGERLLYAEFIMPNSDVNIKFEINKDGSVPVEFVLDNNILDSGNAIKAVSPINTTGMFELDYNVLSKKVNFSLANGADIEADLEAPRGNLYGNAWGTININNETPDIYNASSFNVTGRNVTEPAGRIIKHPRISTTIYRKDATYDSTTGKFDDPKNRKWLNKTNPKTRNGIIKFRGTAYGKYEDYVTRRKLDGSTYTERITGTTSAAFNSGTDTRIINTYIYNGMPTITPKVFENKIDDNTISNLEKKLWWTSEPYKFNVIRWMCHQNEDNSLYDWTTVPGQYQRTFTQQNIGIIEWESESTLANNYKHSREAARRRDYQKSEYDKAVFASDTDFKNVDYPIKSGYYFNPTGTYTFSVETVTYKPTQADTKEHKDLVDAVVKSFRYETDLMYINSYKEPVNIQNELLPRSGNNYGRRPASLTAEDPTGVDGVVLLNVLDRNDSGSRYSKKVEVLQHSENSGEYTHEFWKEILEGYEESGTIESKNNFKYREYIKNGQNIYKITEKTNVTIQINPENRYVYTHAHMPNGKYTVKVWIGDIELSGSNNEYKKLGALKGISQLDEIEVSVKGSMYDDAN